MSRRPGTRWAECCTDTVRTPRRTVQRLALQNQGGTGTALALVYLQHFASAVDFEAARAVSLLLVVSRVWHYSGDHRQSWARLTSASVDPLFASSWIVWRDLSSHVLFRSLRRHDVVAFKVAKLVPDFIQCPREKCSTQWPIRSYLVIPTTVNVS